MDVEELDNVEDGDMDNATDTLADTGDQPDDASSMLSDPEDEQDGIEEQDGIGNGTIDSDGQIAHALSEVDSEAETERLEQTPQKQRKHVDSLGRTPSKLSQAATADDDLSDPPSPVQIGAGAASSTSTIATLG